MHPSFGFRNAGFFAMDDRTVVVRGEDNNLWYTPGPFGQVPNPNRGQIDSNVAGFHPVTSLPDLPVVMVIRSDDSLWSEVGMFPSPQGRAMVDTNVFSFQVADNAANRAIFVLRNDGTLWYDPVTSSENPAQVDGNVGAFWALDSETVLVVGTDGNLWYTPYPFGQVPNPSRILVDSNVYGIQAPGFGVYSLRRDSTLWWTNLPSLIPSPSQQLQVDGNVAYFQALDDQTVFVAGTDGNLWFTPGPFGQVPSPNRQQVDGSVKAIDAVDSQTVFVLGTDGNLWYTPAPFGQVPNPQRGQVDGDVYGFQAVDDQTVFVLGYDANLWYTPGPFHQNAQIPNPNRLQVDGEVWPQGPVFGSGGGG